MIRRELRTMPGEIFSRADLIRSQREFGQLNYFNQETIGINPVPNPDDGTVDINYKVEEKSSDQLELSAGWGGGSVLQEHWVFHSIIFLLKIFSKKILGSFTNR